MTDAVIFDLDNTLYEYENLNDSAMEALCWFTCEKFGLSSSLFLEAFGWAKKETKGILGNTASSHNRLLYFQRVLEYIGERPTGEALEMYETYWGYMLDNMRLRDGAKELLEYCKSKEIKIGICTDLTAHIQHRKIRKLEISSFIDAIVTSEEAGAEKPAEIMYRMILDKLKIAPGNSVFIGDNLEKDVKGPLHFGMDALWFHKEQDKIYHSVSSFVEVMEFLDGR